MPLAGSAAACRGAGLATPSYTSNYPQTPQLFGDFAHNLNAVEGDESRQAWVEDMDTDKPDPRVRQGRMGQGAGMASMGAGAEQRALPLSCPPTHLCALAQELRTPTKDRAVCEKRSPIHGVVLGATERSYLMRDSQIDVMRNVVGGVEDTGLSFKLTPPPGAAGLGGMGGGGATPTLTPPKALLMNQVRCRGGRRWGAHRVAVLLRGGCSGASGSSGPRLAPHTPAPPSNHPQQERKMNMISPLSGASLWHADIETGKVVSEWKFQKDGVDVAMKDITTENKGAQVRPGGGAAAGNGWRPPAVRVSRQTPDRSASSYTPTPTLLPAPHCRSTTALCSWGWTPTGWHGGTCATRTASCPRPPPPWWRTQAARTTRAAPSSGARAGGYGRLRCRAVRTLGLAEGGARHGCHAFPTTTPPPASPAPRSCMATSGDGYVVVGADDGKVRLYSEKTLTQAKTSIPGMGLPITSVDVTYDGGWARGWGGAGGAGTTTQRRCAACGTCGLACAQPTAHPHPQPRRQVGAGHHAQLPHGHQDQLQGPQVRQGAVRVHQPHGRRRARAPPAAPQDRCAAGRGSCFAQLVCASLPAAGDGPAAAAQTHLHPTAVAVPVPHPAPLHQRT